MNLLADLRALQPGDRYTVPPGNYAGPMRISDLAGRQDAPIAILGGPGVRFFGDGGKAAPFCLRFDDCPWVELGAGGFLIEECMGFEARGLQVFTSDHITVREVTTRRIWLDDLHFAGCNHVLVQHHRADGTGDKAGRGGAIGAHAVYFTSLEGGGDCEDLVYEDGFAVNVLGGCFQANGDGQALRGVVFRRVQGVDYGAMGGAGFNLEDVEGCALEDVTLSTRYHAGGVRAYGSSSGVTLTRYAINVAPAWEGPVVATAGGPALPRFGPAPAPAPSPVPSPAPSPVPPPGPDLGAQLAAALRQRDDAWNKLGQIRVLGGQVVGLAGVPD